MSTPQAITQAQIQSYRDLVEEQGINAVAAIYQALADKGHGYAGWAYGVATGDSITGHGALDYMMAVRERLGQPPLTDEQVNNIREGMLKGYLDALIAVAEDNGGVTNQEIEFETIKAFHQTVFNANNLSIEYWTLHTPMSIIEEYYGLDEVNRVWQKMVETNGTGLDALLASQGLLSLVVEASQGVIYLDSSNNIITSVALANRPELMSQVVRTIDTSTQAAEASEWMQALSGLRGEGSIFHYWAQQLFGADVYSKVGDQNESGQDDYILLVNPITDSDRKNIVFGLGGKDTIYGASAQDRLYGGNADDELYGKDGGDYLYGGLDNDKLYGGSKNDYLNGGKGNDILDGGEDDDILVDESGNDTYTFSGNFGHDTIFDQDASGKIKIDGVVITVGEKINNHLWKSADGQYTLSLVENSDGVTTTQQVIITKNNSDNSITIKYFNDGALGLIFGENEDTTNPPEDTSIYAFGTDGNNIIYDERYVASFAGNDYIQSTNEDAVIIAGDGNDFISTSDGNDVIYAGLSESTTDRDIILSGKGNDQIYGGAGNDLIMTSTSIYHPKQSILNDVGSASSGTTELNKEYEFLNSNYLVGRDGDNIFSYYVKNDLEQITEQILPFLEIFYSGEEGDYFFRNVVESLNYGHGLSGSDIAYGGSGNDIILGSSDADFLYGEAGDDSVYGMDGNDFLYGGDNDDTIYGGDGSDEITGGSGNDNLTGGLERDIIYGGDGDDIIVADLSDLKDTNAPPISANYNRYGNDVVHAGAGNDKIWGNLGNDEIYGDGDDDEIYGDHHAISGNYHGADKLFGGDGEDKIWGDGGEDIIRGGNGDDKLSGDNVSLDGQYHRADIIEGEAGNDTIWGQGANDTIYGGDGNDSISGDDMGLAAQYHGDDNIFGDAGDDIIAGDGGSDEIYGGDGKDILYGDNHVEINFDLLSSRLPLDVNSPEGNTLDMERLLNPYMLEHYLRSSLTATNFGYHGNDRIYGGLGNDIIFGHGGSDSLYGGDDNDVISGDSTYVALKEYYGFTLGDDAGHVVTSEEYNLVNNNIEKNRYIFSGSDKIYGGNGNDRILGGLKNDLLDGGDGNDIIYGDNDLVNEQIISRGSIGAEIPRIQWQFIKLNDERFTKIYPHFEQADGEKIWNANDTIFGGNGNDQIYAEEGDDLVHGGGDNDVIYGDQTEFGVDERFHGNDELYGDDGEDKIFGDGGADRIFGGNDNDYLYGDGSNQEGQMHGNDTLFGGNGGDEILGQGGNDEIHGEEGADYINGDDDNLEGQYHGEDIIFGGNGKDYIIGNGKRDIIHGGADNDIIYGDSDALNKIWHGNDELYGGEGNDKLYGGSGDDSLDGDLWNDQLSGGEGNDQYQFSKGHGQDIIFENEGSDKIVFNDVKYREVTFLKLLNSLIITGYSGNDSISIADYFLDDHKKVETIEFEDQVVVLNNITNLIKEIPIDPITNLPYQVMIKNDGSSFNIHHEEKIIAISQNTLGSFLVSQSENIQLVGGDNNYFSISNSDNVEIFGGNGIDNYNLSQSNVKIYDNEFNGVININTAATYFKWSYDFGCDGWLITSEPIDKNLIEHQQNSDGTRVIDTYKLNENSLRLNDAIYDARSGEFIIQKNDVGYVGASAPGEVHVSPAAGVIPQGIVSYSNIYIQNVYNQNQIDLLFSNMKINLSSYGYSLVGGYSENILNTTISLKDYVNQGNVTSYYTDQSEIIHGFTNYSGSYKSSDKRLDTIYAGGGDDQVITGLGNSLVFAEDGDDLIIATDTKALDEIYGGVGADTIYNYDPSDQNLTINYNSYQNDKIYGGEGNDNIYVRYQSADAYGGEGNDTLIGDGNLYGGLGDDQLIAGDLGAYLDGGAGIDHLIGGLGDDTFIVDEFDTYEENDPNGGYDTLNIAQSVDLSLGYFEAVTLAGNQNFNILGNAADNRLIGNDGNNHIDGRAGSDYMAGGLGNDYYVVDVTDNIATNENGNTYVVEGDQLFEEEDGGIDTLERWQDSRFIGEDANGNPVLTNSHRLLEENIENLILKGNAKTAFGNDLDNIIVGNNQDNYIDGLSGNDTYVFAKGGGTDTFSFYDEIDATNILKIQGYSASDLIAQKYGNSVYLSFKGTSDHIWLSNYYVADTANTTYRMDQIIFDSGTTWTSTDIDELVNRAQNNHAPTVNASIPMITSNQGTVFSYKFASNVIVDQDTWDSLSYKITLTTTDSSGQYQPIPSWLSFDAATQTLSGTPPSNVTGNLSFFYWGTDMYGRGAGTSFTLKVNPPNQTPIVLNAIADQTVIDAKAFSYTVPSTAFKDPDNDVLTYSATLEDGSPLPSWLTFNTNTRVLSGTSPDNAAPLNIKITVKDTANQTVSDVFKITFVVQNQTINGTSSVDTLYGASGNDVITGQAGNDTLYGQSGNDTLNGGTGNDTMYGGKGDDTYVVDSTTDVVNESANEGTDTVQSTVTYTLSNNLENLTLTGSNAINGTGNALNNTLVGNSAVNTLTGGAGDDYLDGGTGNDKLLGGLDNDTYVVDSTSDLITENTNEGVDTVRSSVTLTLANNLENLNLLGTSAINGTGNALNNILIGNTAVNILTGGAGNDYLDGATGADKLFGGVGNDIYVIDNTGDTITENTNEGTDTVLSTITYTLGNNLENLALSGSAAINATGNTLNNTLIGNSAANTLNGGAGNDILIGGIGSDILFGSTGADIFVWGKTLNTTTGNLESNGLNNADGSTDIIKDFNLSQSDKVDAKALLDALGWNGNLGTLSQFVSVSGNTIDIHNVAATQSVNIVVEGQTFSSLNDMITKTNFQTM